VYPSTSKAAPCEYADTWERGGSVVVVGNLPPYCQEPFSLWVGSQRINDNANGRWVPFPHSPNARHVWRLCLCSPLSFTMCHVNKGWSIFVLIEARPIGNRKNASQHYSVSDLLPVWQRGHSGTVSVLRLRIAIKISALITWVPGLSYAVQLTPSGRT
jgi:hypothetical protein